MKYPIIPLNIKYDIFRYPNETYISPGLVKHDSCIFCEQGMELVSTTRELVLSS